MRHELPSQEVLEGQVNTYNRQLAELAQRCRQPGFTFEPGELEQLEMADSTTTASFWKHFIGGQVNAVVVMQYVARADPQRFPVDRDLTKKVQWQCYSRTTIWQQHPKNRNAPLEREGYEAFLGVCASFDWSASSDEIIGELNGLVQDIGDTYTMLEGKLPLSMIMHNLREEGTI